MLIHIREMIVEHRLGPDRFVPLQLSTGDRALEPHRVIFCWFKGGVRDDLAARIIFPFDGV